MSGIWGEVPLLRTGAVVGFSLRLCLFYFVGKTRENGKAEKRKNAAERKNAGTAAAVVCRGKVADVPKTHAAGSFSENAGNRGESLGVTWRA